MFWLWQRRSDEPQQEQDMATEEDYQKFADYLDRVAVALEDIAERMEEILARMPMPSTKLKPKEVDEIIKTAAMKVKGPRRAADPDS